MKLNSYAQSLLQYVMDWVAPPRTKQAEKERLAKEWLNKNCPHWQQKGGKHAK